MKGAFESRTRLTGDVLFFDATCALCCAAAKRWNATLQRVDVAMLPLQSGEAKRELRLEGNVVPDEMKLISGNRVLGGADAVIHIAQRIWWARPLACLAFIPGMRTVLRRVYGALAARRHCWNGACRNDRGRGRYWLAWLPLFLVPAAALLLRGVTPDWAFMWIFALSIFSGCKWLTWWRAAEKAVVPPFRSLAYLIGWVGMDAERFLNRNRAVARPAVTEWLAALVKTSCGAVLVWIVARNLPADMALLRGWCGLVGMVFLLHFGTFHLLSLAWHTAGVDAQPIMHAPAMATSLAEFWGRRWNVAFHHLAEREVFKPILRRTNAVTALFITFALSGVIHDAVISFPARGGYGLPTCYFLLQGCGVLGERSSWGRRIGFGRGWRGRVVAWIMTIAPLPLLFHDAFITRVIVPFLTTIGAL